MSGNRQLGLFDASVEDPRPSDAPMPVALPPVNWRHPRANRECRLGAAVVAYEFQRSPLRPLGMTVGPLGLTVRAPRWTPLGAVDAWVQSKASWILSKLQLMHDRQRQAPATMRWHDGAVIDYLGQTLRLTLDPGHHFQGGLACVRDGQLLVGLAHDASAERLQETVQAWLRREAQRHFGVRLDHYAPQLGVRYSRLRLSSAGTRWGSASADGSIRLNWRLIHLGPDLIDYVVAHELSHLREMNHSSAFWAVLGSVMHDYDERRRALKRIPILA